MVLPPHIKLSACIPCKLFRFLKIILKYSVVPFQLIYLPDKALYVSCHCVDGIEHHIFLFGTGHIVIARRRRRLCAVAIENLVDTFFFFAI